MEYDDCLHDLRHSYVWSKWYKLYMYYQQRILTVVLFFTCQRSLFSCNIACCCFYLVVAADFDVLFAGNSSDDFRIGISVSKKSLRLYSPFSMSDIVIADPLGLVHAIGQ